MADRVGQRFGEYRLTRFLGQGSFGEVYLGEHVHECTLAAIKVLQARLTSEDLKEFINEASATFRLKHPHIVQLLDFGINVDDILFLVMDYAPHGTLRQRHPKGSRLPLHAIVDYVKQISAALQYAHGRRLIHRDVKPENILLGPNNEVLLSDFGIAVVTHSSRSVGTLDKAGTVSYMAPEQLQGKPRPASDQYALGVMVYEWVCGNRPFNGTATEVAMQHLLEPPPPLRAKVPTMLPDVEHVVMTALAKDPESRFASIQAFAQALTTASEISASPQEKILTAPSLKEILPVQPDVHIPAQKSLESPPDSDSSSADSRYEDAELGSVPSLPAYVVQAPDPSQREHNQHIPLLTASSSQIVDKPLAHGASTQANTTLQQVGPVNTGHNVGRELAGLPQQPGEMLDTPLIPTIVPGAAAQSQVPPVSADTTTRQQNLGKIAARPPASHLRCVRWLLTIALALIAPILLIGSLIISASPGISGSLRNFLPFLAPLATVTITPRSSDLTNTYELIGVTGTPDPGQHQVQARLLTSSIFPRSDTVHTTATSMPGTQATGTITFYNSAFVDQQVTAGTDFALANGVHIITDSDVGIPKTTGTPPYLQVGVASVSAHAGSIGPGGNIAALTINTVCCSADSSIFVKNLTAFTGGRDPQQGGPFVLQSDIDGAAKPLEDALTPQAQNSVKGQIHPNEHLVNPVQCVPNVSSDHSAGDKAANVTVTVKITCSGEVYDQQAAQMIASDLLKQQATKTPGPGFALVGNLTTTVTQVMVTDPKTGTLLLQVKAEGIWVSQFSDAQRQALVKLIAHKSTKDAQALLLAQADVAKADIALRSGKTLPTDPSQIALVVQNIPGLPAPPTPMTGPWGSSGANDDTHISFICGERASLFLQSVH
jgi:serine/threonine protein kinase